MGFSKNPLRYSKYVFVFVIVAATHLSIARQTSWAASTAGSSVAPKPPVTAARPPASPLPSPSPSPSPLPATSPSPSPSPRPAPAPISAATTRLFSTAALGVTKMDYTQTGKSNYSGYLATAKITARYRITNWWDLNGNVNVLAQPITATRTETVRMLDVNLRTGAAIPFIRHPWRLTFLVGVYYVTMLVDNSAFGFQNMTGPQAFPVLTRVFGRHSLMLYAKYSPVANGSTSFTFSNNELAGGASWASPISQTRYVLFGVDYSRISLSFSDPSSSVSCQRIGANIGISL